MRLLLDTHIWLWTVNDPKKLTLRVRRALGSGKNELWLSPISIWEFLQLAERQRLKFDRDPGKWIENSLEEVPLQEAPFTYEVAQAISRVRLPHRDPADLFLAATAAVFDLALVTADERLLSGKGYRTYSAL